MNMVLYSQADFDQNRQSRQRAVSGTLLCALPFLAAAVAGFILRLEVLCIAGSILCGAALIFLYDLRIAPALRYGRYLREVHSGLTRRTLGTLVRLGDDPVYEDGVNFFEVILNIYEDQSPEGERRFLADCSKPVPGEWLGRDVVITSHGSFVLEICLTEERT